MTNMSTKDLKDLKLLSNFLEEYSWINRKYRNLDLDKLLYIINNNTKQSTTKENLIGKLPSLLQDRELFEKNSDLAEFAATLNIEVKFAEKRSRYEIIGAIICQIQEMDETYLVDVKSAIEHLVNDSELINSIKRLRRTSSNYDWNTLLQAISKEVNESKFGYK